MTVREVFDIALKNANKNRNNWVGVINIKALKDCYVSQIRDTKDNTTFTLFLGDAKTISLIRPISNQVGINIDSNYFIYADAIRIVDMCSRDEFIINKDGIVDDEMIKIAKATLNSLYGMCKEDNI